MTFLQWIHRLPSLWRARPSRRRPSSRTECSYKHQRQLWGENGRSGSDRDGYLSTVIATKHLRMREGVTITQLLASQDGPQFLLHARLEIV